MNTEIIIIDDLMSKTDPFIRQLSKNFENVIIKDPFTDAEKGVDYVLAHLDHKMIIFLDCKFDSGIQGYEALKRIREKTSLVYIIMMSSNSLYQMPEDQIYYMINHRGIFFINRNDTKEARAMVERIINLMDSKLDCILEQWVLNHENDSMNTPYIRKENGEVLTLSGVLGEIRTRTKLGQRLERNIMLLAIDLLTRGKKVIPDD